MFSVVLQLVSTLMHKWVKSTRSSNYLCLWELRINVSHLESWKIKLQVKSTSEKALLRVCWVLVYLTAEGIISIHLNIAHGAPRCSSTHFILLSHDIGSFVPDFAPLFSPGLEGSWVEKMLSMKKDKRDECNLNTHTHRRWFFILWHLNFHCSMKQDEEKNTEKCNRTLPRLDCSSVQVEIQGRKRSRYLLKPRYLVAFDSSIQDEGRAEAKDVS